MKKLESLLQESTVTLAKLKELTKEAQQELYQVVQDTNLALPNGDRIDFHTMLCELAYAELDCREHFKRFPQSCSAGTEESAEDWSKCHRRREAALDLFKRVAIAYVRVADVMET